ncbi:MAG: S26 family signal peptidase [Candidatus Thermoplasmatota archaeon]|nr:S26 family signal peptidase [Candidatus Thermoplasmatota archaeon]
MVLGEGHGRDGAIALLVVGGILLALFLYTGNWPPPVVIESNSMMHVDAEEYEENFGTTRAESVGYGRIGTIDPGDLVLVKSVDALEDVATFADGGDDHYGKPGEVIVYFRSGNQAVTPIIHRAMTYVERSVQDNGNRVYEVRWSSTWADPSVPCRTQDGTKVCTFGEDGITIPELKMNGKHFQHSGFITQGDNVVGNQAPDQVLGIMPQPVRMEWIDGVARGELPWFGLIKLMLTEPPHKNVEVADHPYYWSIGKMTAPKDLWVMLGVGLGAVVAMPLALDHGVHWVRTRWETGERGGPTQPPSRQEPPPPGGTGPGYEDPSGPWSPSEGESEDGREEPKVDIDME